ncbi:MAG TPA: GNAT family N-acetyltransferase [Candidatus Xenobia bacterium]
MSGSLAHLPDPRQVDADIELRKVTVRHAGEVFSLIDRNRPFLRRWMPWLDDALDMADTMDFVRASEAMAREGRGVQFGVWYRHVLAGLAGFNRVNRHNRQGDIGYWLGETFQGRGIMRRTVKALVGMAFEDLELHRVQIFCAPGNTRSRAIPEALGFRMEGTMREAEWLYDHFEDSVIYSRLATDGSR